MLKLLGLDIGTTTVSAVAVDAESGEVLSAENMPNDSATEQQGRQNPYRILEIVQQLKSKMQQKHGKISAIGITGQMHGIVYLDKAMKPVSPLYTWQDNSGEQSFGEVTYAKYLAALTGYKMASGYGLVTDYVNRKTGNAPPDAISFCTVHDWVAASLCQRKTILMHASDAASLGCFDIKNNRFDGVALEKIGLNTNFLPEVTAQPEIIGTDSDGVPVTTAIGDNQASVIGSVSGDGCALANIGTGSQISVPTDVIPVSGDIELRPLSDGTALLVGAPLCGGRSFALLKSFYENCLTGFGFHTDEIYKYMDIMAAENPDEHSLRVDTRFCGTRESPLLRGSVTGIGLDNFTPQQLTRGFLRGMAQELFELFTLMKPYLTEKTTLLVGSGNAIRKSPVLRQYLSETFSMPVVIPKHREEAAFGAAVTASVAVGIYSDLKTAQAAMIHYL